MNFQQGATLTLPIINIYNMLCRKCGKRISRLAKFCSSCGSFAENHNSKVLEASNSQPLINVRIYECANCQLKGPAKIVARAPWRWWYYIISFLFFPIGLLVTIHNTGEKRLCVNCGGTKIKKRGFEYLPKHDLDPDVKRNRFHHRIITGVVIALIVFAIISGVFSEPETLESNKNSAITTESNNSNQSQFTELEQADYNEGYKSGYTDGRASQSSFGDNYIPPATVERRDAYALGYLSGFVRGCQEGNFNCSEVEKTLTDLLNGAEAPAVFLR